MSRHLVTTTRRRPGLVLLALLYGAIAVLVARTPLTVVLCAGLVVSVAFQLACAVRRAAAVVEVEVRKR